MSTIDLTGGQLAFPATQSASADANTLDDYEEGEWTITITCSTSGSYTLDSSNDTGAYTKIGKLVHVQGRADVIGESSPNGDILVSLPITSGGLTEGADILVGSCVLIDHGGSIPNGVYAYTHGGSTFRLLTVSDAGVASALNEGDVDTAWRIYFSFSYIASN